jgi:hypothetical protein
MQRKPHFVRPDFCEPAQLPELGVVDPDGAAGVDEGLETDGAAAGVSAGFAVSFDSDGFDSAEDSDALSELFEA